MKAVNELDLLAKNSFSLLQLTIGNTFEMAFMIFKHQDMIFTMCIYLKLRREILSSFLFMLLLLFLRRTTLYFNEVNFCILGCLLEIYITCHSTRCWRKKQY